MPAMITAMDDQIGKVVAALERKGMRDNTLIVFQQRQWRHALRRCSPARGQVTGDIPADNGPYRDGKGILYEGGTRVVALANWPGHIPAGQDRGDDPRRRHASRPWRSSRAARRPEASHSTASTSGRACSSGAPSPRSEIVYNVEPFRAASGRATGSWCGVRLLPPKVELFDLGKDPGEANNLAAANPQRVQELQARVLELAGQMAPPLFLMELVSLGLSVAPVFPDGEMSLVNQD